MLSATVKADKGFQGSSEMLKNDKELIESFRAVAQIALSGSLKRFLLINLGEVEEKRFQLFEPEGRVLESPVTSLRLIQNRIRTSEKRFGQQPVKG